MALIIVFLKNFENMFHRKCYSLDTNDAVFLYIVLLQSDIDTVMLRFSLEWLPVTNKMRIIELYSLIP